MLKVGLRAANYPSKEETLILIDHVQRFYGNHNANEIRQAFDLALTDQLEIDKKEIECYENFSCMYFSKIMNSYREWKMMKIKTGEIIIPQERRLASAEDVLMAKCNRVFCEQRYYTSRLKKPLKKM